MIADVFTLWQYLILMNITMILFAVVFIISWVVLFERNSSNILKNSSKSTKEKYHTLKELGNQLGILNSVPYAWLLVIVLPFYLSNKFAGVINDILKYGINGAMNKIVYENVCDLDAAMTDASDSELLLDIAIEHNTKPEIK